MDGDYLGFLYMERAVLKSKAEPRGLLGLIFSRYVPLASQSFYSIIVYSVVNYRSHLSHFWANM